MRNRLRGSLLAKVGLLSAFLILVLGLVLGQYLRTSIRDRALQNARETASIAARLAIQPKVSGQDLVDGLTPDRLASLDADLRASHVLGAEIARVRIWGADGRVVYSDDAAAIGQHFEASDELQEALAGHIASEISDLTRAENAGDRAFGQLLEVYVPLYVRPADASAGSSPAATAVPTSGPAAGAFEIYLPYKPIAATIAGDTRKADTLLLAGLTLLFVMLFRIVAGASRTLRRHAAANEHLALHDSLTGLPNRTLFQLRTRAAVGAAERSDSGFAVMLLDLDRFKEVNDTLGHDAGDQLLRLIGARLEALVGDRDVVSRLGGDEFAILLPSTPTPDSAAAAAARVLQALREPFILKTLSVEVETSLGVVLYPRDGDDEGLLLQRADVAMYAAKERKTGIELYRPEMDSYSAERLVLLGELRRAIARDELVLHYQPTVDMTTGRAVGAEALVRWQHPVRGLLPPSEFLPMAEHTELIGPLTTWVLGHALAQTREWAAAGLELEIAVNLSARTLHHPEFPSEVARLLRKWDVDASRLVLEVTESAVMADPEGAMTILTDLRALGVRLAIDDFGTGYSSLTYLKRLPVNDIKIDQSFVRNMHDDSNDAVIVRSTVDLGHNLGLRVVAEGIETREAWDQLAQLGCDLAQGYLVCRPAPADQFTPWLVARGSGAVVQGSLAIASK
jgi:diguanylate cyclase (GGDEF)-like protein